MQAVELELPNLEKSGDVLSHAMTLAQGFTIGKTQTYDLSNNGYCVLIWELTCAGASPEVLVIMRKGRQFIGCRRSKGSFKHVSEHYRRKALESSETSRKLLH